MDKHERQLLVAAHKKLKMIRDHLHVSHGCMLQSEMDEAVQIVFELSKGYVRKSLPSKD